MVRNMTEPAKASSVDATKPGLGSQPARATRDDLVRAKLDFGDAVAEWFVRQGEHNLGAGRVDESLRQAQIAASVLTRQNRRLSDPRLERLLQAIAARLDTLTAPDVPRLTDAVGKPVWLHVLEEALPAGGLTSMATRWIEGDSADRTHGVVLMGQRAPVPARLEEATGRSGGTVLMPPEGASAMEKAVWLRAVARANAAVVVLHAGVSDTVTLTAFGTPGGPPVLLVNHAAHIYWIGSSVADFVINCRGSALEIMWTERHRLAPASVLPIPLVERAPTLAANGSATAMARARFGLPPSGPVILTIGARFKYDKTADHDFLAVVEEVLNRHTDACLLAIGVVPDQRWKDASARVGGRIVATGPVDHASVALAQSIATVYAEGFPFGTTTSLLESGLSGLPAVLAPATAPPPYGSDGVALDCILDRPADASAYREQLSKLLGARALAQALGERLGSSIREHHTGEGWRRHLSSLLLQMPAAHSVRDPQEPARTPTAIHARWVQFVEETDSGLFETIEHATIRALMAGLRPRFDAEVQAACARAHAMRRGQGVPSWCLRLAINRLLPAIPLSAATLLFRALAFCSRRRSWRGAFGRTPYLTRRGRSRGWYDSYGETRA